MLVEVVRVVDWPNLVVVVEVAVPPVRRWPTAEVLNTALVAVVVVGQPQLVVLV